MYMYVCIYTYYHYIICSVCMCAGVCCCVCVRFSNMDTPAPPDNPPRPIRRVSHYLPPLSRPARTPRLQG